MYALIKFAGKQYSVEEGSSIKVPYINGKVGSKVTIDKILYMDDGKNKTIGTPLVNNVKIDGKIESHGRERKVVVFKFKRRKGYQKKNTHRQEYSMLKVGKFSKITKAPSKKTEVKSSPEEADRIKKAASKTSVKKTTTKKTSVLSPRKNKKEKE